MHSTTIHPIPSSIASGGLDSGINDCLFSVCKYVYGFSVGGVVVGGVDPPVGGVGGTQQ